MESFAAYAYSCHFGTCEFSIVFLAKNRIFYCFLVTRVRVESFAAYAYSCRFSPCKFSIVFWLKTKENSHALKRQLYAYAANDSTLTRVARVRYKSKLQYCSTKL